MKEKLSATTVAIQGSGWGWLGYNKASGGLQITACPNQVGNTPHVRQHLSPKMEALQRVAQIPQTYIGL
jgi:superoxide dismutase